MGHNTLQVAEVIALQLRRELYCEATSIAIWRSLSELSHAEAERDHWAGSWRERGRQRSLMTRNAIQAAR